MLDTAHRTRQNAAHVGVQDDRSTPERERADSRCRVLPDAREGPKVGLVLGQLPAMALHDRDCRRVQVQRPTRVPKAFPLAHRLTRIVRGQRGGGGPPAKPRPFLS